MSETNIAVVKDGFEKFFTGDIPGFYSCWLTMSTGTTVDQNLCRLIDCTKDQRTLVSSSRC